MAKLDVLYQFDENYAAIGGVSITTLFKNNTDIEELTVYIAAKDVSAENLKKLDMLAAQYQRRIVYLNVERIYDRLNRLGANGWNGSLATWMKVFVVQEIPETVEQLLYIDSDTLVLASLRELAEIDMGNHMVAAVIDSISRGSAERLRLDTPYFNAGLLLLNFSLWRKEDTVRRMHLHLSQHIAEYPVNDQDLINDYFRGRILKLNPRYNFQGTHFFYKDKAYFGTYRWPVGYYNPPQEIEAARRDTAIIHFFRFCGQYPWQPGNIHPCRHMFQKALDESLWKGQQYTREKLPLIFKIEKILYQILPQRLFLFIILRPNSF